MVLTHDALSIRVQFHSFIDCFKSLVNLSFILSPTKRSYAFRKRIRLKIEMQRSINFQLKFSLHCNTAEVIILKFFLISCDIKTDANRTFSLIRLIGDNGKLNIKYKVYPESFTYLLCALHPPSISSFYHNSSRCPNSTIHWPLQPNASRFTKIALKIQFKLLRSSIFTGWELLKDPAGRDHFLSFLEKEYATENLLFVESVWHLKKLPASEVRTVLIPKKEILIIRELFLISLHSILQGGRAVQHHLAPVHGVSGGTSSQCGLKVVQNHSRKHEQSRQVIFYIDSYEIYVPF